MAVSLKSVFLVSIQFLCLAALILTGSAIVSATGALVLEIASVVFGIWTVYYVKRIGKLNVFPELRAGARLIYRGPYTWIRHPMYLAVILFGLSLLLDHFSWLRSGIWIILTGDLLLKIRYEEGMILKQFPEYGAYIKATKKLIPFIF